MTNPEHYIFSSKTVSEVDQRAIQQENIPGFTLMKRAAAFGFHQAERYFSDANSIMIFCGSGNNSGDAYLLGCLAIEKDIKTKVITLCDTLRLRNDALKAFNEYQSLDGEVLEWDSQIDIDCDLIIDGIFGIGINRNVEGKFLQAINKINDSKVPVLSLDIPSGLNANSGEVMGSSIKADVTTTFVGRKKGLYLNQGPLMSGWIEYSNLSIPEICFENAEIELEIVNRSLLEQYLKPRTRNSHKGDFGHVLVIAGNHGMGGAARITSESALRTGAGLVSVITRPENVAIISKTTPEIMAHSADDRSDKISELFKKADVIAIGPGLGTDPWARDLFDAALNSEKQLIIDADGLNLLADSPTKKDNWILTPHPGEAARLLRCLNPEVQEDRLASLEKLIDKYGGVTLLKGNNTLVGAAGEIPFVVTAGNPGMSTAGMGDLLTGIIAALCSQFKQVNPKILAALGAYIHALAGDQAAKSGERGIIATDLFGELKDIINP